MTENGLSFPPLEASLLLASRMRTRACLQQTLPHDLQVPLNAMRITLDLLAGKLSALDLVGQRYLRVLDEELLHLSKLLAGAFDTPDDLPRRFDLAVVLEKLALALPPGAARLGVTLQMDMPPAGTPLPLFGPSGWLEQAFLNIAVGRMETLGRGGHLHITAEPVRSGVRIVFADDGPAAEAPPDSLESLATRPGEDAVGQFVAGRVASAFGGCLVSGTGPGGRLCFDLPLATEPALGRREKPRAA